MTRPAPAHLVSYRQVRKEFLDHPVRHAEVPVEHAISLPVPTLRWSLPGYGGFAGPATRAPGQPLRLGTPDRWWALHAEHHRLIGYGLIAAFPFAALGADQVLVDRSGRSVADAHEDLRLLDELMDQVAGSFLAGSASDAALRSDLLEALTTNVTDPILPWYRAFAPDFFSWLEG